MRHQASQRGAALLVVLVLVAGLAAISLAISLSSDRALRRVTAAQTRDQAYWAMIGAERAAIALLDLQAKARENVDLPTERWLSAPYTIPFEGGLIEARFRDASACFNVHDLVRVEGGERIADEEAIKRFGLLVAEIGGDSRGGETLATAAADFMDRDGEAGLGGAEDYAYSRGDMPYLTAGGYLADVTELRAVSGWTSGVMTALAPWLCVREGAASSSLNLNTLTERDAPLLANALDARIPLGQAERLIADRPPDGYQEVAQFLALPVFENLDPPLGEAVAARLSTEATLIEFTSTVRYDGILFELTSVIEKGTGDRYRVIARRFGPEN